MDIPLNTNTLPTYADVVAASERLKGVAHLTPVVTSTQFDNLVGCTAFFKCENFQRMGAFKFRGAYNALASLSEHERKAGVVAFSSGNHAQAIALAARTLGMRATIVMPHDAPAVKRAATEGYGADIVTYNRNTEDRETVAARVAKERGGVLVPPYDHAGVIAGQGTAAKELFDEVGALDYLLVCTGGAGFLSGSALSARALSPQCKVIGVEPEKGNDAQQSFRAKKLVSIDVPDTIADGARTQHLGEKFTFALVMNHVDDILTASDTQLIDAMKFVYERMKLVIEPTGVLAMAAVMNNAAMFKGKRVGIMLSGGNVDLADLAKYFTR